LQCLAVSCSVAMCSSVLHCLPEANGRSIERGGKKMREKESEREKM